MLFKSPDTHEILISLPTVASLISSGSIDNLMVALEAMKTCIALSSFTLPWWELVSARWHSQSPANLWLTSSMTSPHRVLVFHQRTPPPAISPTSDIETSSSSPTVRYFLLGKLGGSSFLLRIPIYESIRYTYYASIGTTGMDHWSRRTVREIPQI